MFQLKRIVLGDKEWWDNYYLLDYIAIIVVFIAGGMITVLIPPYHRYMVPNDPALSYPYEPSIVPDWLLVILAVFIPIFIFFCFQIYYRDRVDLHHATVGLLGLFSYTIFVTTCMKTLAGRPRPNYYADDIKDFDTISSFPSGHSSTSFAGMVYLSLYIAGKLRVFSTHSGSMFLKLLVLMCPMALCIFVAVSRTMDYHHNFDDITAGAFIGTFLAFVVYFMYYPSLFDPLCDKPKLRIVYEQLSSVDEDRPTFQSIQVARV